MTDQLATKKTRDPFFDALKFVLIAGVVFLHIMQPRIYSGNTLLHGLYTFLVCFVMPCFIFVSGYFSKNMSWSKFVKGTIPILITYILFQIIYSLQGIIEGNFNLLHFIIEPKEVLWYLQSLVVWRLVMCFAPKHKYIAPILIIASIGVALVLGFKMTTLFYESLRIITFFPYFLLGYYCSPKVIEKVRSVNKVFAFAMLVFIFLCIHELVPYDFRYSTYGTHSYKIFHKEALHIGLLYRVITYPLGILISVMIFSLVPPSTQLAKWGKMTLPIYLFHMLFLHYMYLPIFGLLGLSTNLVTDFVASIFILAVSIFLGRLHFVQAFIDPMGTWQKSKLRTA